MTIIAAADGSALGNPGPSGWAWYVDESCWHAGGWPHGTNNQGELMAVLDLFRATAHLPEEPLRVLCDSQYVINCVTKWIPGWKRRGWKKADGKPVLNVELLKLIDAEVQGRDYTFEWVKGHAGHSLNEAADQRARACATAYQNGGQPDEGPGFPGATNSADTPSESRASASGTTPEGHPVHHPSPASRAAIPEQEDLFSALAQETPAVRPSQEAGLAGARADGEAIRRGVGAVVALEQELLDPEVREDVGQLTYLLHPEFQEVGASGRLWDRAAIVESLTATPALDTDFELLSATPLSAELIQVLYRSRGRERSTLRSSLWQLDGGRWRLRFHQGTIEP